LLFLTYYVNPEATRNAQNFTVCLMGFKR
jgi:hypothetical protein